MRSRRTETSISPVARLVFTVPGGRRSTVPSTARTNSTRIRPADLVGRGVDGGVEHELRQPVAVPEVHEDEAAVIAAPGRPPHQGDRPAGVAGAQCAARMRAAHPPKDSVMSGSLTGAGRARRTIARSADPRH